MFRSGFEIGVRIGFRNEGRVGFHDRWLWLDFDVGVRFQRSDFEVIIGFQSWDRVSNVTL